MAARRQRDPIERRVLRTFNEWELPKGMLLVTDHHSINAYLNELREVAGILIEHPDKFISSKSEISAVQRNAIVDTATQLYDLVPFARKVVRLCKADDGKYAVPIAKIFSRIGSLVEFLSFLAGPLTNEHGESTFFELAWMGNAADEQRRASLAQALQARTNPIWRERAIQIWIDHPKYTHHRVASEITAETSADKRSVMRAIKNLIPESSPSHPTNRHK